MILVTGSTSGLGREVARRLAADGADVIVHGRNVERGEALVREIEASGVGSARFYRADFSLLDRVRCVADSIRADPGNTHRSPPLPLRATRGPRRPSPRWPGWSTILSGTRSTSPRSWDTRGGGAP